MDEQEAKDHGSPRKQLFDHGQPTVSGLATSPLCTVTTQSLQAADDKISH